LRTGKWLALKEGRQEGASYIVEAIKNECCNNASKGQLVADTREEGLLC